MLGRSEPHFSFAGLKTAVRQQATGLGPLTTRDVADLAAGFEAAAVESVIDRVGRAMELAEEVARAAGARHLVVAGGVAANRRLRAGLETLASARGASFHAPPVALCGDNAAMVAWTGAVRIAGGMCDGLDVPARARWPLDARAMPVIGAGRLGAKA
jgi:N6-L-threonylcarbamoyladenine synthase